MFSIYSIYKNSNPITNANQSLSRDNKEDLVKKNILLSLIEKIKNFFKSLYSFFMRKNTLESKIQDLEIKLDRVEQLSNGLAIKEADKDPIVYRILGEMVFDRSYNIFWKLYVSAPKTRKNYLEIGQMSKTNNKYLIESLKAYYTYELVQLKKRSQKS